MPLYEYECQACGERFETIRKFSDPPLETCARCGKGPVTRLLSSPAIQFKGSGWYITDYAKQSRGTSPESGKSDKPDTPSEKSEKSEKPAAGKTESSKTDSPAKPASTTKSKD
jgi:putative FmdB family regulatory protein